MNRKSPSGTVSFDIHMPMDYPALVGPVQQLTHELAQRMAESVEALARKMLDAGMTPERGYIIAWRWTRSDDGSRFGYEAWAAKDGALISLPD